MAKTERESKLQANAIKSIRRYGAYVYKNAASMYTEPGRPDLTLCVPVSISKLIDIYGEDGIVGIFIGLELKRDGHLGEVSDAQRIVGSQIIKSNGMWMAVDNLDEIKQLMSSLTEKYDI